MCATITLTTVFSLLPSKIFFFLLNKFILFLPWPFLLNFVFPSFFLTSLGCLLSFYYFFFYFFLLIFALFFLFSQNAVCCMWNETKIFFFFVLVIKQLLFQSLFVMKYNNVKAKQRTKNAFLLLNDDTHTHTHSNVAKIQFCFLKKLLITFKISVTF